MFTKMFYKRNYDIECSKNNILCHVKLRYYKMIYKCVFMCASINIISLCD